MIRIQKNLLFYSKLALAGSLLTLLIILLFLKPKDINERYEKIIAFKSKEEVGRLAPRKRIEEYNLKVKRDIFNFTSYDEAGGSKNLEEESLDRFSFNGIIVLDEKRLAIYDNKEQKQHLIKEGESLSSIKVKEIKESSAIIEMNYETMEINF
jgi:hypothetical protein